MLRTNLSFCYFNYIKIELSKFSSKSIVTLNKFGSETKSIRMKFILFTTLMIACFIVGSESWCWPGKGGGGINVCKNQGKSNCLPVSSTDTCINLIGGPFVSGYSQGHYSCTIHSSSGCSGTSVSVDKAGWSKFPFKPQSVRCPCV
jgi:hypothetical protein